ncbi:MAG: Rpn family recombination-promoting nuclease/putative transposase [Treponema sp.]
MEEKDNQNRQYQDSVFVHLFTHYLKKLLAVCKALDPSIKSEEIELITLENTLYTGLKNDISCKVENKLIFLIEHQSTVNENMPLRCLQYIGRVFEKILEMRERYARLLIKIPTPEFYVFYTGDENLPAIHELALSKAFIQETEKPQLELIVKVINLNSKENNEFLDNCPILKEYAEFVRIVKEMRVKYGKAGYDKAIRYCIKHNILKDYIVENAKGIEGMLIAEYDYDLDIQVQREECYNAGILAGIQRGEARGEARGFLTTALRMKKANFDISVIQEITGLSKEEISKL